MKKIKRNRIFSIPFRQEASSIIFKTKEARYLQFLKGANSSMIKMIKDLFSLK
jgi:hypothetical protein